MTEARPSVSPSSPPSSSSSPPSRNPKILPRHTLLLAMVYLRQSTTEQVRLNLESQRRQYALRDRALVLGWIPENVRVIDEDLGRSGSESANRAGFQCLISEVALGHVGLILALEASRLARNSEDWQHLLRLCSVTHTLLADAENVYDPRLRDDRILLGVKGQLSEWELDTLRDRLVTGAEHKARRGELYTKVPSGFLLSEEGVVELHPDEAVRGAIAAVFRRFREQGSACATARTLREEGLRLPVRQDAYGRTSPRWTLPTFASVWNMLTNPFYAGAYAYGRSRVVASATADGRIVKHVRQMPFDQWFVCLPQHHPGYTSWGEYLENQQRLQANRRGFHRPGPVGDGPSLLAGILRCGPCGRSMRVSYGGPRHTSVHFRCSRVDPVLHSLRCQSFGGSPMEQRVSTILIEVLGPHGMEATLLALQGWEEEREQKERQWDREVTRAEEAEARARRKHEEVEPGHRLVARTLEQAWEKALQAVEEARRARDLRRTQVPPPLTEDEQRNLSRSSPRLEELWKDPRTSWKDRKEIVRLLIHHVEVWSDARAGQLKFRIHWVTGMTTEDHVRVARASWGTREVRDSDLEMIRRMAPNYTDSEIARALSKAGRRRELEGLWTGRAVKAVREAQGWEKAGPGEGKFATLQEAMRVLGASQDTVYRRIRSGEIKAEQPYPDARWRIDRGSLERCRRRWRR